MSDFMHGHWSFLTQVLDVVSSTVPVVDRKAYYKTHVYYIIAIANRI